MLGEAMKQTIRVSIELELTVDGGAAIPYAYDQRKAIQEYLSELIDDDSLDYEVEDLS
jgi:hypothetical protein